MQRDPAGVPAHHLDDEDAVVGLGGGVQPVDGLGRDVDRGVEAEGEVGAGEVVVDRLGDADDVHAEVGELGGDAEGVLAADRDQRVDAQAGEVRLDLLDAAVDLERVGTGRAEDGTAARQDAADLGHPERLGQPLQRATPAVPEAQKLVTVGVHTLADHRADHRVQAGAVAAAGQHTDTHNVLVLPTATGLQRCREALREDGRRRCRSGSGVALTDGRSRRPGSFNCAL